MNYRHYSSLTFLVLLVIGCGGDGNPIKGGPIGPKEIMPLTIGNQWWGTSIHFDSTGLAVDTHSLVYRIIGDTTIVDSITVDTILGDTIIHSEIWFKWETEINDTIYTDTANSPLFANRPDGFFGYVQHSSASTISFKFPAIVGDTFTPTYATLTAGGTHTVISIDTTITVPNGSHDCYLYSLLINAGNREARYFLAPNIGFVRWESDYKTSAGSTFVGQRYELDSLMLN